MIELTDLTKSFDGVKAVDHLQLRIETGEFFGLLGPNGAGKTTTISMLSTVLLPSEGTIRIDGEELTRRKNAKKGRISVVTQEFSMRQDMTVSEVMEYQGRLYRMPKAERRQKTEELLAFADLTEHRFKTVRFLSGGMKRKLMICRALMTQPEILLLDEPTAGMDALARRQMWNLLRRINSASMTIILTTHYMEEAEALCDRVALMDRGRLDLVDTPQGLIGRLGAFAVDVLDEGELKTTFYPDRERAIAAVAGMGERAVLRPTTLEDVFVERMGSRLMKR